MKVKREGSIELGATIRKTRSEKGMTITCLAEKARISQSYLSQIELGKVRNPSIEVVCRIFEALDADLVLDVRRARRDSPPTLAYGSPFTLEELASMDEEYSGQEVVQVVREVLKDPRMSVEQRRLLGRQIAGLVKATRGGLAVGNART